MKKSLLFMMVLPLWSVLLLPVHADQTVNTLAYRVNANTTLTQLARVTGVSVQELRALNKGRFSRRDTVKAGERIVLPATARLFGVPEGASPASSASSPGLPSLGSEKNEPAPQKGVTEQNAASVAQTLASQDLNHLHGKQLQDRATEMAKGKVLSQAQQGAQEFLGKFGKAQVNLSVDGKGNFSRSSASLLTPLYDQGNTVVFSQAGVHNQDGRMIANLGAGQRIELDNQGWMLGYNAFYDRDMSRGHQRVGVGGEAWTDNLKVAANYYHPLSSWKDSPDIEDHSERPARGFDVRAQGYLPSHPQLGASVMYEQYFGKDVALFGKDNLQKNPHAVTVGVDYTPIPLITLKASHKQGQKGSTSQQLDFKVNYQMGTPLEKQLSPDYVATARSLKGSRYDLVDRNNDIVLEYRENTVMSVDLPGVPASLLEGDVYVLNPLVRSKYTITGIAWEGDVMPLSLMATAGLLNPQGWQITLPAWNPMPGASNRYRLAVTLEDEKGHKATSNSIEVVVAQARQSKLSLTGSNTASIANNEAVALVMDLFDHRGNPVNDSALSPKWTVMDVRARAVVPVVSGASCPVDGAGHEQPCVRLQSSSVSMENGVARYHAVLASSLEGAFMVVADSGVYGQTNPMSVVFNSPPSPDNAPPASKVARVEILSPDGVDIFVSGDHPKVGSRYRVRFYDSNNVDITDTVPSEGVKWLLHGASVAGCSVTLNNAESGVTGYEFTPRVKSLSSANGVGTECGDQGFSLRVSYVEPE